MYQPRQHRSQSRIPPTSTQTSNNQNATGSFRVPPQTDTSQPQPEIQKYTSDSLMVVTPEFQIN